MTKITDHPLTETAVHVTDEMVQAGHAAALGRSMGIPDTYRRIITAALTAAPATTDPHHDPRPWQDCTHKDIRAGDLVEVRDGDRLFVGVAHHQDSSGDWRTKDGYLLTWDNRYPLRRIPAPTPPAEEVELPTKAGTVIEAAEGHEFIEADVSGRKYYAREAMLSDAAWYGAWRTAEGRWANSLFSELITPGTWTTETLNGDTNE